jgi:hypothetical protein
MRDLPGVDTDGVISTEDYLWYVDDALDDMVSIVVSLGDELANRAPDLPGANAPFAILTHCLGVMEYWSGQVIAGRKVERDRPAEFLATGAIDELALRARRQREQLARDLAGFEAAAPPRGAVAAADRETPLGRTQGGVLFHIYEELAQHRGQLEITRDVLRAGE